MPDHVERARLLYFSDRYELCAEELREALLHDPENGAAHSLLGLALMHLDRIEDALRAAEEGIRLDPERAHGHYSYAVVLNEADRPSEAEMQAREALRLQPDHAQYHGYLAGLLIDSGDADRALVTADRGLGLEPDDDLCLRMRAAALLQLGRIQESIQAARAALAVDPEDPAAHSMLARALERASEPQRARGHYIAALRLDPRRVSDRLGVERAERSSRLYRRAGVWLTDRLVLMSGNLVVADVVLGWLAIHAAPRVVIAFPLRKLWVVGGMWVYIVAHLLLRMAVARADATSTSHTTEMKPTPQNGWPEKWKLVDLAYFASLTAVPVGIAWAPGTTVSFIIDSVIIGWGILAAQTKPGESLWRSEFRFGIGGIVLWFIGLLCLHALHG